MMESDGIWWNLMESTSNARITDPVSAPRLRSRLGHGCRKRTRSQHHLQRKSTGNITKPWFHILNSFNIINIQYGGLTSDGWGSKKLSKHRIFPVESLPGLEHQSRTSRAAEVCHGSPEQPICGIDPRLRWFLAGIKNWQTKKTPMVT